ncbi:MAG: polysaccharide deacetylase family protein [Paracoccaceae bacterium]
MRVGLWRFLDALETTQIPATFFMCGRAVARAPDLAKVVAEKGHEPACHGWLWQTHAAYSDREAEQADLIRATDTIETATGKRPLGFFCRGAESSWTRDLLSELGYLYSSNSFDDDLPYCDTSGLSILPYNLDCNDMKFFHPNGFTRSAEMVEYVKDALAQLLHEAAHGRSATLSIGFHLRITGRPARFRAVQEILSHLASLEDQIWRARRIDIVRHFQTSQTKNEQSNQHGDLL